MGTIPTSPNWHQYSLSHQKNGVDGKHIEHTRKKQTNRSLYLCAVSCLLHPRIIFTAYVQNVIKWVKDIEGLLRKAKRISSHFHIPLNFIHLITLGETKSKHFKFSHKCQLFNFNKQSLSSTNIIFLHTNACFH